MNLDEIEDLIRRYLSAGITVVIILVAPTAGGTDEEVTPGGEPSVITIDPQRSDQDDGTTEPEPTDATDTELREPADTPDPDDPTSDDPAPDDPDDAEAVEDESVDHRENDPAEDRDGSGGDTPEEPSTVDEQPTDDTEQSSAADEDDADDTAPDAPDREVPDRDREVPDRDRDEPDLEARGPADGSEPGIDDEQATGSEDPPTVRDPAEEDPAGEDPADQDPAGEQVTEQDTADEASADRDAVPDTRETDSEPTDSEPTAAERYGWGTPDREDDFDSGLAQWDLYDGPGHAGEGQRSPDAVSVQNGILTITGDAEGTTGGMTWGTGQRYGRWEGRVRAPASDPSYNALLLLWPDAEDFPEGGEIDFMEMLDPTRRTTEFFLHHGADNDQVTAQVEIDGTEWHNWAVEWTPDEIVGYVDGVEWFRTSDPSTFPPGPMHLCIQLDWFPAGAGAGEVQESTMEVDWVRQYALDPADDEPVEEPDRDAVSTEPASVVEPALPDDDPLRRMFSWS